MESTKIREIHQRNSRKIVPAFTREAPVCGATNLLKKRSGAWMIEYNKSGRTASGARSKSRAADRVGHHRGR